MGDVVGDLPHSGHQPLDLIEHRIQVGRELVELVAGAGERHALGHVAVDDPLAGAVHGVDPAQHVARHEEPTEHAQHDGEQRGPSQGLQHPGAEQVRVRYVAPDQEMVVLVRQLDGLAKGLMQFRCAVAPVHLDGEADPVRFQGLALGPAG